MTHGGFALVTREAGVANISEYWQQLKSIFNAALEQDESAKPAYLDAACESDPELRSQATGRRLPAVPSLNREALVRTVLHRGFFAERHGAAWGTAIA